MNEPAGPTPTVCYNHPDRETVLRCNRCERYICTSCAVLTPTGYRCKECVRGQQKVFETSVWYDYLIAIVIAGVLSLIGSYIASYLGFFTIFVAPVAGVVIAEAVRWAVRRRRSRLLFQLTTAATVLGGLPILLILGLGTILMQYGASGLLELLWPGVYIFLSASTVYYRLSGIEIR